MRNAATRSLHIYLILLAVTVFQARPAQAQFGEDSKVIGASFASVYARYYSPYAIQAAAAYTDVQRFDSLLGPSGLPTTDGSDVALAVQGLAGNDAVLRQAKSYLQSWRYQFGSTGYLRCYQSDSECLEALPRDKWTVATADGPTFHVWARQRTTGNPEACNEISIVFRGSTISLSDWASNFNPLVGRVVDDEYRQLRRNIDAIIKKVRGLDCVRRAGKTPQIVSVGHSLGGGLAQLAAFANNPSRPKIAKVFAFDPSPVTGAHLVDPQVLKANLNTVQIDRIYQTGEVLQHVRAAVQQPPSPTAPCVRSVAYDVIPPVGLVGRHNMTQLAGYLVDLSYFPEQRQQVYRAPRALAGCKTLYTVPDANDEAIPATPAGGSGEVAGVVPRSPVKTARYPLDRSFVAYADTGRFSGAAEVTPLFVRAPSRLNQRVPNRESKSALGLTVDVATGTGIGAF